MTEPRDLEELAGSEEGLMEDFWPTIAAAAFLAGLYVGAWLEARIWRAKATSGFRKESANKLYSISEDM